MVQWLRLYNSTAGGPGSTPGGRIKIPQAAQVQPREKKKRDKIGEDSLPCLKPQVSDRTKSQTQIYIQRIPLLTNALPDISHLPHIHSWTQRKPETHQLSCVSNFKTVSPQDGPAPKPCWRASHPAPCRQPAGPSYGLGG